MANMCSISYPESLDAVSFAPSRTRFSCVTPSIVRVLTPVLFASRDTIYCHQPAGKMAGGTRFNIRPRTRPRWFREADKASAGGGGSKGGDVRDPRLDRDRRGGMQRNGGEIGAGRGFREARGAAGSGPGYNGRGGRGRGRVRAESTRTPSFRVTVPDDIGRHLALRRHYKNPDARSRSRSRSWSRGRSDSSACSENSDNGGISRDDSFVRCDTVPPLKHLVLNIVCTFTTVAPITFHLKAGLRCAEGFLYSAPANSAATKATMY